MRKSKLRSEVREESPLWVPVIPTLPGVVLVAGAHQQFRVLPSIPEFSFILHLGATGRDASIVGHHWCDGAGMLGLQFL